MFEIMKKPNLLEMIFGYLDPDDNCWCWPKSWSVFICSGLVWLAETQLTTEQLIGIYRMAADGRCSGWEILNIETSVRDLNLIKLIFISRLSSCPCSGSSRASGSQCFTGTERPALPCPQCPLESCLESFPSLTICHFININLGPRMHHTGVRKRKLLRDKKIVKHKMATQRQPC